MITRMILVLAAICLPLLAAQDVKEAAKPITSGDLERFAEQTKSLRERGGGDAKAWKKYREAARKALKNHDYREAERQYAAAAREAEGFKPRDERIPESLQDWGRTLYQNRKYRQSMRVFEDVVSFYERISGSNAVVLIDPLVETAAAALQSDQLDIATNCYHRATEIAERHTGPFSPVVGEIMGLQGMAMSEAGRTEEAEKLMRRALQLLQTPPGGVKWNADGTIKRMTRSPVYTAIASVHNNLALIYQDSGRNEEADFHFREAVKLYTRETGKDSEATAMANFNLGMFLLAQKKDREAEPLVKRSLAIREKLLGKNHMIVADSLLGLAEIYKAQGKTTQAEELEQRSHAIRRSYSTRP